VQKFTGDWCANAKAIRNRSQVTARHLLAVSRDRSDAVLAHVSEIHRPDLVAVGVVGAAGVAGRAGHRKKNRPESGRPRVSSVAESLLHVFALSRQSRLLTVC
jgi:hypothetical protein